MNHHTLIRSMTKQLRLLKKRVHSLELDVENLQSWNDSAQQDAEMVRERASRDRQRADEAERTARNQQYDLQDATAALEKAQRYGDDYAIERAPRKLKRLT